MALQRFNSVGGGSTTSNSKPSRLAPRMSATSLTSPSSTSVMSAASSLPSPFPSPTSSPSRSSNLVALRYEETVQAKPPIMVTTKRTSGSATSSSAYLARSRSTLSTRSLATTSSRLSTAAASSSTSVSMPALTPTISPSSASTPTPSSPSTPTPTSATTRYPLVILRPPGLVVPPTEQHPALRTPTFHPIVEEGCEANEETGENEITPAIGPRLRTVPEKNNDPTKRDSILASSAASTVSVWPEDAQDANARDLKEEEADVLNVPNVNSTNAVSAKDPKEEAQETLAHAQHAENEDDDDEDDGYSSCMCRSASRRSKVASVVCPPAPVREAPPPPEKTATNADDEAVVAPPAASRVSMSARPSVDFADPLSSSMPNVNVTHEKSWRLPRTSFSFRASAFQRQRSGKSKKNKRTASVASVDGVQYEDGLIPVVVLDTAADANNENNENGENNEIGHDKDGRTAGAVNNTDGGAEGANHILPAFTAQSPLLPAGPFQFSAAPSAPMAAPSAASAAPLQRPHQHTRLSKPNPSWHPMLASQPPSQHAPIAPSSLPLGTNAHLPSPSMPLPSISSFASFATPSLPYIPAIEGKNNSNDNSTNATSTNSSPSPTPSQPNFILRVLSMSDSRQKRQQQQQQQHDRGTTSKDNGAIPKREKDEKKKGKIAKRDNHFSDLSSSSVTSTPLINTAIPTERLLEDDFLQSLTFSKRGSLMFGGKRAIANSASAASFGFSSPLSPLASSSPLSPPSMDLPPLAPAIERESLQVRSLYASGTRHTEETEENGHGKTKTAAVSNSLFQTETDKVETEDSPEAPENPEIEETTPQVREDQPPPEDEPRPGPSEQPEQPHQPQLQEQEQPSEQVQSQDEPSEPQEASQPTLPDVSTLSVEPALTPEPAVASASASTSTPAPAPAPAIAPTDHLRPDAAARASASNNDARTSIISATSATTASTGIALTEGTESSLSLAPTTTPQASEPPSPFDAGASSVNTNTNSNSTTSLSSPIRNAYELAGGLEDWEDVNVADVDRFGFIHVRRPRPGTAATANDGDEDDNGDADEETVNGKTATSSSGGLAGIGRHFSRRHHSPSSRRRNNNRTLTFNTGNGNGARSVHTSRSTSTTATAAAAARSSIRAAANQLPHNKDRRWIDEAGEMLTLEPGLADIAEDEDAERLADVLKRKEWERAEKWRRMAKAIQRTEDGTPVATGAGMDFEFDLHHPKLVERTWKGIPDRWRAPAWYSFLASSAKRRRAQRVPPLPPAAPVEGAEPVAVAPAPPSPPDGGETDTQIIAAFHRLQDTASPDDVQIDLDVPRTVNGHVMFRKRYRGGQRLLFRVLHALSLYFHATGYVQGMASLAATLLCYYDEERCFVMLVRLFHLRGLERLYEPGFGGLMEALGEYEQQWLARSNRRVAQKLTSLNIDATTYATRWYLTLFNLSVPFPAQLRIWDVFMLLGDADNDMLGSSSGFGSRPGTRSGTRPGTAATTATSRPGTSASAAGTIPEMSATAMITANAPAPTASKANLGILHATSTALIDGLQEVLLDADFENAMKAVTSWVPIKDEDLLMKVVHAEWKRYQKRKARR